MANSLSGSYFTLIDNAHYQASTDFVDNHYTEARFETADGAALTPGGSGDIYFIADYGSGTSTYLQYSDVHYEGQSDNGDAILKLADGTYTSIGSEQREDGSEAKWPNGYPVCFARDTLIMTPAGEVVIQDLQAGDVIVTRSGPRPIKWVGHQHSSHLIRLPPELKNHSCPIHILPNAFDSNCPQRRMTVSPWHHILLDGCLVRAMDLVNGISVYQDTELDHIDYYHIELDTYDMISAAGVWSESFSDNGNNRGRFDNIDPATLPADWRQRRGRSPRPGFTVVRPGDQNEPVLRCIQNRLLARARQFPEAFVREHACAV